MLIKIKNKIKLIDKKYQARRIAAELFRLKSQRATFVITARRLTLCDCVKQV